MLEQVLINVGVSTGRLINLVSGLFVMRLVYCLLESVEVLTGWELNGCYTLVKGE
jgi:hypothetical protein